MESFRILMRVLLALGGGFSLFLGTLFFIQHWSGGREMLVIGLILISIAAFDTLSTKRAKAKQKI